MKRDPRAVISAIADEPGQIVAVGMMLAGDQLPNGFGLHGVAIVMAPSAAIAAAQPE
jgi:hypothetical protein